jgi:salicylate hydroxylase
LGHREPPRFAGRAAWRAVIPAAAVAPEFREPWVQLWLGRDAHLVHYPVKGGTLVNVVLIADDVWHGSGWSQPAGRDELLPRLRAARWADQALSLIALPDTWLKWALFERRPLRNWSQGAAALIGDAAHPILPYLAQGAAMAIEDAVVAAQCLASMPDDAAGALRAYCIARRARTAKVQRLASRNGGRYHLSGLSGTLRDAAMRLMGGTRLLRHYDWLYDWRPPAAQPIV